MAEPRFVPHLPDLIQPDEYAADPDGAQVRVRIRVTAEGVEVLGDSPRPEVIERLLEAMGATVIDQMLCG